MPNLIGSFIKKIYILTNNFALSLIIFSFIIGIICLIIRIIDIHNMYIKSKYAIKSYEIKKKEEDNVLQLEKINELYRSDNYIFFIPYVLKIFLAIINISIFITLMQPNKYIMETSLITNASFLTIKDIFAPKGDLLIPLLCSIFTFIYIFINDINKNKTKKDYFIYFINSLSMGIVYYLYEYNISSVFVIYILGTYIFKAIPTLVLYKKQKEINVLKNNYDEYLKNIQI